MFMIGYPIVTPKNQAIADEAIPTIKKSLTVSHGTPLESSKDIAFILGNDETGSDIPPEHMRAVIMTKVLGCGSGNNAPILEITGNNIRAPTVCEIKLVMTTTTPETMQIDRKTEFPFKTVVNPSAITFSSPQDSTALPSATPPIASITTDQSILFQSSLVKIPVPKNATIGKIAIIPISPTIFSNIDSKHHSIIVITVTVMM